jgi:hypothetical protein
MGIKGTGSIEEALNRKGREIYLNKLPDPLRIKLLQSEAIVSFDHTSGLLITDCPQPLLDEIMAVLRGY